MGLPRPAGRPRSCTCGECFKCKRAAYMRKWWNDLTPEQKREKIARRDPESVRRSNRKKMARRRAEPSPHQREVFAAHRKARTAVQNGQLVKEPCEVCGATEGIHGHHDDHSKPLEVRWLCPRHHYEVHGLNYFADQDAA